VIAATRRPHGPRSANSSFRRIFLCMRSPHRSRAAFGAVVASFAVIAALALLAPPARASLVVALDMPTMVQRADHIAVVDVGKISMAWDETHEHIFTTIELSVVETMKGPLKPAAHLALVQPGGTVGDISMKVYGMTPFSTGERALVFLRGAPDGASVVGMSQGKRAVRRDATTGQWMVHVPDQAGASFVRTTPASTPLPIFEMRARPLDELRLDIQRLVGKATGR
jgi:hypothetical protein